MKTRLATRREQSGRWHPPPVWFARDQNRRLTFFAGLWTRWTSGGSAGSAAGTFEAAAASASRGPGLQAQRTGFSSTRRTFRSW
jgi:hypothetical protein